MIVDGLVAALLAVWEFVVALLPEGNLTLPNVSSVTTAIAQFDSLLPIIGPLTLALTILSALAAFIIVRIILVVVNIVWP